MTLPGQLTVEKLLTALDQRLAVWSRPTYALVVLATTLGLSLFFFCPRLCLLLGPPYPGTFEWDRGLNFLAQSQDPFHAQVEPALRWRLAPPLAAHILQLRGYWPFIVPWIGLAAMLLYGLHLAGRYFQNRLDAALFSLFTGTLAAVSSVTMAHGINDGWLMLAMLASIFARHPSGRLAGALLGPWVDERYLLCLPLCLACRHILTPKPVAPGSVLKDSRWEIIGILPYVATRLVLTAGHGDAVSSTFLTNALAITPLYLPNTHLGWWMGLRAGWLLVAIAVWAAWWWQGGGAPH
jgi:hypothetical protein